MSAGSNAAAVLADLAKEINEHEDAAMACMAKSVMHGIRIGQLLIEAKKVTPHGGFIDWVKANTKVSQRQAQRYMAIASDESLVERAEAEYDTVSHLTLRKAVELAGKAKRQQKREQELTNDCVRSAAAWRDSLRKLARNLGEAREQHFKGADEAFTAWLIDKVGVGEVTARRAPELLDQEYDDEAWMDAAIDDLEAKLNATAAALVGAT